MKQVKLSPDRLLAVLLAAWCVLNLLQGFFNDLSGDEAYYWVLSKDLGWGYFDHPPLVGWLAALGTAIFGDTELGVRFFSILLQPLYLYLFWIVVRTRASGRSAALTYFLIAFSLPVLQLYGFVATPDAPLMMTVALTLWSYKKFLESSEYGLFTRESLIPVALLGLSVAAMGYAKYHGALVVGLIVLSNLRLLLKPRIYLAAGVALVAFVPHILWQMGHDWVSFAYHLSGRTSGFDVENLWLFFVNLIAVFHPVMIFLFLVFVWRRKEALAPATDTKTEGAVQEKDRMVQAMVYLTWGFLGFFLYQTMNVHVQPQWLLPIVFPMLFLLTRTAQNHFRVRSVIIKTGLITAAIYIPARIFLMAAPDDLLPMEIFNNRAPYQALSASVDGHPFITNGNYVVASKMQFYGANAAHACPNIYGRSSHYQFQDNDAHLYMKRVAVEISDSAHRRYPPKVLDTMFQHAHIWRYDIYYDTISDYVPTRNVRVVCELPEKILSKIEIPLEVEITNPYPFNIPLGQGSGQFTLLLQLRRDRFNSTEIVVPLRAAYLPAKGVIRETSRIVIPEVKTAEYVAGFSLQRFPFGAWFNSDRVKLHVVNPYNTK